MGKRQSVSIFHKTRSLPGFLPVHISEGRLPLNQELEYRQAAVTLQLCCAGGTSGWGAAGDSRYLALNSGAPGPPGTLVAVGLIRPVQVSIPCGTRRIAGLFLLFQSDHRRTFFRIVGILHFG